MSSVRMKWLPRSVGARLLLLNAALCAVSSIVFFGITFTLFSTTVEMRDIGFAREALRQFTASTAPESMDQLEDMALETIAEHGSQLLRIRIIGAETELILPSDDEWKDFTPLLDADPERFIGGVTTLTGSTGDTLQLVSGKTPSGVLVQIGYLASRRMALMSSLFSIAGLTFLPALAIMLLMAWLVTRATLSGIAHVRQAALAIYDGNLDTRVRRTHSGDEIDLLAETFNMMLSRIHQLIGNMRDMLDNVAHDLRTPLMRLRGLSEMALARNASEAECRELVARSLAEYDMVINMVNTILSLSQAEAGTLVLKRAPLQVDTLLSLLHDFFSPLAARDSIQFAAESPLTCELDVDRERILHVFLNLLDNAFKFTPPGGIISVSAAREGGMVRLDVTDNGPGIDPADLPRVFDRLYRAERGARTAGYGLGLSFARAIVELHGGRITATSPLGEGTTMSVYLPLAASGTPRPA